MKDAAVARMNEEANVFALELLMPEHLFEAARGFDVDMMDDNEIGRLARRFRVPLAAVVQRINLGRRK